MKNVSLILVVVVLAVAGFLIFLFSKQSSAPQQDRAIALDPAIASHIASKANLIVLDMPQPNTRVSSPLAVSGKARGYWFFEASFPVKVIDESGAVLGVGIAQAQEEWMTEEFVPFIATVTFSSPETAKGVLVLEKDNPSGLPEHADELRIPVSFDVPTEQEREVKLYYYNAKRDKDTEGNIMCSRAGLEAVTRALPVTQTPIQDAINLLLRGGLTLEEKGRGITTEFPLEGVALTGASLSRGTLTLSFDDPNHRTGGGSCRVGILWFQIEETAKQFPGVQNVRFIPEELFQP